MRKLLMVASLAFVLSNCSSSKKVVATQQGVDFVQSEKLMSVLEMAGNKEKLVFVDFYTTWCLPCKMMDEDVFPDKGISKLFNDNFISYKIDAEKGNGPNLALIYQVQAFPTLLFLDKDGKVLVRKEGAAYHSELRSLAEEAMAASSAANLGE
ncbi:MAG: thioredoxin family protein [Bacteroidota bacterium]